MSSLIKIKNYYYLLIILVIWLFTFINNICIATVINQIMAIHVNSSSHYTRITLESNAILKYKHFVLSNPNRIVVDLKKVNLNLAFKAISKQIRNDDYYVKDIRIGQFNPLTVRMVFELKRKNTKLRSFTIAPMTNIKEYLVIDLYSKNSDVHEDPLLTLLKYTKETESKRYISSSLNNQIFLKKRNIHPIIIMLDPGHGGEDSGAIGKYHTYEKDVVLQIARRLKKLIEKESNMYVYITRNEDVFLPLKLRIAKAQKQCADLFISIHADACTSRQPSGSSVFTLSAKSAINVATKYLHDIHNTSNFIKGIRKSGDFYLDHTIFDMAQLTTMNDSMRFAKAVLKKLSKINKLHKHNVGQASYVVLSTPDIPSILIETAFISNEEEECKLKTATFQQKLAESILAGIKAYLLEVCHY